MHFQILKKKILGKEALPGPLQPPRIVYKHYKTLY